MDGKKAAGEDKAGVAAAESPQSVFGIQCSVVSILCTDGSPRFPQDTAHHGCAWGWGMISVLVFSVQMGARHTEK